MSRKSMLTIGFLSMVAAIGVGNAADSWGAHPGRVDVIGSLNETLAQKDSVQPGVERTRVDVVGNIGSEGPEYRYTEPVSR